MSSPFKPSYGNVRQSNSFLFSFLHKLNTLLHPSPASIINTRYTPDTANTDFDRWLQELPGENELKFISKPRRFAHDETKYDEQYQINPTDMRAGQGLVNLLRFYQADFRGPGLEIGCGTGRLSVGLVAESAFPTIVLTDPSPAFLDITRHKLQQINLYTGAVQLAVLMAEEIDRLPPNTFALIVLRSTLHHVMDVPQFIHNAARALRPGGVLTFEEPCMEGYVLMGAMAQFIPLIIKQAGAKLGNHHSQQIQLFVDTMRFYARRDIDKSKAEDKHLFRVDEIMKTGDDAGLSVEFLPNTTYDNYVSSAQTKDATTSFYLFFRNYLRYCMSFDETLVELLDQYFRSYCQFIEDISKDGNGPYMHGVFVCQKR